jgi:hypothetical protein
MLRFLLPTALAIALLAGSLLAMCDSVDGEDRCTGYIAGVADALALAHRYGEPVACIPPYVAGRQMRRLL